MIEPTATRMEQLKKVAEARFGGKTAKILITQLDPDAMGAGMGMLHWLDRALNIKSQIFFCGGMDHPQNRSIYSLFSLGRVMKPASEFTDEDFGDVILVDSSSNRDVRVSGKKFNPAIVIDHHEGDISQEIPGTFHWVEPVGAASTLVGELLMESGLLDRRDDMDAEMVATMLAIGIATDTHDFRERAERRRDREVWDTLMDYASAENYGALLNYDLPPRYYELLNQITDPKNSKIIQGSVMIARAGLVSKNETAFLAEFADLLLRKKEVQTVLVWAPVDGVGFAIKMRTVDSSESLVDRLQELFSSGGAKSAQGISSGGTTVRLENFLTPCKGNEETAISFFSECLDIRLKDAFK